MPVVAAPAGQPGSGPAHVFALVAGVCALGASVLFLLGWVLRGGQLMGPLMKTNTAVGLAMASAALALLARAQRPLHLRVARWLSVAVGALGGATLFEYAT